MTDDKIELKTPEDVRKFWADWRSSRSTVRFPSGKTYGIPRPRCECTVRVSGKVITLA